MAAGGLPLDNLFLDLSATMRNVWALAFWSFAVLNVVWLFIAPQLWLAGLVVKPRGPNRCVLVEQYVVVCVLIVQFGRNYGVNRVVTRNHRVIVAPSGPSPHSTSTGFCHSIPRPFRVFDTRGATCKEYRPAPRCHLINRLLATTSCRFWSCCFFCSCRSMPQSWQCGVEVSGPTTAIPFQAIMTPFVYYHY